MIKELRQAFNKNFDEKQYRQMVGDINRITGNRLDFRICETPVFFSKIFAQQLVEAGDAVLQQLFSPEIQSQLTTAIPNGMNVPNPPTHPAFIALDFAIACDRDGSLIPQLIECQAFPTTFCFEYLLDQKIREYFTIPDYWSCYFNGLTPERFISRLRTLVLANHPPENVILLEITPEQQKTRADFVLTEKYLGVKTVAVSEVIQRGNRLYYRDNGREIPIKRIYNRVIFDELIRRKIQYNFHFRDELEVEWVGHPNWFFQVSKYALPIIKNEFTPPSYFLSEWEEIPTDLSNFVLKPLYSFGGTGVKVTVSRDEIEAIADKENYLLQEKVTYAPIIETPQGFAKAEVRLLYFWKEEPLLTTNHVRVSRGDMMGVDFNKKQTWVGATVGYHPLQFPA